MSFPSKDSYKPLMQEDEEDSSPSTSQVTLPRKASNCMRPILIGLAFVFCVFLTTVFTVLITAALHSFSHTHASSAASAITTPQQSIQDSSSQNQEQQQPSPPHYAPYSSCGSSPTTARSRGCTFDLISFTWQTTECYDASLSADFDAWAPWIWYADEVSNTTVPREEAVRGERNTWVSWEYHVVHCTFMWIQMHRAFERGWIGHHLHVYEHTLHCQGALLGMHDEEKGRTPAVVLYPRCERVGSGEGMYPGAQFGS